MAKIIRTLSGRGNDIHYEYVDGKVKILWGKAKLSIEQEVFNKVLNSYLIDKDQWYPLGASMTEPIKGGLGEYLRDYKQFSPRYASVIGAIMYNEGKINYKGKGKIMLKRI